MTLELFCMISLQELQQVVEHELNHLSIVQPPVGLYKPIEYLLSLGGKRIRPVMCLASCALFSKSHRAAIPAALAIELFHNFTLMHDDIMDHAPLRRNKPTVHTRWNANVAILSGDAMMIMAQQQIAKVDSPYFKEILELFNRTAMEVCEGQQYDMEFETRNDVLALEYLEMIRLKTAVLLACSIKAGAILGGATPAQSQALYQFAENMGMAFQLQDDLLDVYSSEAEFGKTIGGDIVANKKTYPLLVALEKANNSQKEELDYWVTATEFHRDKKIVAVTNIYNQIDVKRTTQEKIDQLFKEGMTHLDDLRLDRDSHQLFNNFAESLIRRNR